MTGTGANVEVAITWTTPSDDGGSSITGYSVQIYNPTTGVASSSSECDLSSTVALTCSVKTTTLISSFGYTPGQILKAKVAAINANGTGGFSTLNSSGVTVQTLPQTAITLAEGSNTSTTSLEVTWTDLTADSDTGGSAVTAYNIEWNQGDGSSNFVSLNTDTASPF